MPKYSKGVCHPNASTASKTHLTLPPQASFYALQRTNDYGELKLWRGPTAGVQDKYLLSLVSVWQVSFSSISQVCLKRSSNVHIGV